MLVFDPNKRISIEDALKHPYMSNYHDEEDELTGDPVSAFDFDYELFKLNT
jgi:mitogen-activated protein kinase 1/3